jgi:succinate dehydrogenase / fumarate reductase flavoprotein subunit
MAATPRIIVIGGGLAGLSAVIKIAEMGANVDLFSIVPVKRSHSVCAQGGINAAKNLKGEGDSTWIHFDDTVYGGDFLANQPPVKDMCEAAPGIIDLLDRMGVPFNRTPEGLLDFRRFGGTLYNRTAFAGATTGQQLLYALDEQVRRYEAEGKVKKYEHWEFLSAVLDGNRVCRGICAMDLRSMEVRTFPADAIIICTGGIGAIFGKSTNSVVCTGSAQSALYSGASHLHPRQRQAAPHVGVGARRGWTRLGSEDSGRQARSQNHSAERALVLSRRVVSQVRQPGSTRHRHARNFQSGVRAQPRH